MRLNHAQEKIVRMLGERMVDAKTIAKHLGLGYTEAKVQSMVLTLARKGQVDKTKAALLLRGTELIKFLSYETGSKLKGGLPVQVKR